MSSTELMHDLIVVLPGIMGSTLSRDGHLVWQPSAGAALRAIKWFGGSIHKLKLPLDIGDDHPNDGVVPVELMPDLHLMPRFWTWNIGYGKLLNWLQETFNCIEPDPKDPFCIPNLLPVPYDWRLSNRYNGRRLKGIIEPALERLRTKGGKFSEAKIVFICHSMGGLVARWYIEKEGGAELTRKLITMGTPYRGALSALEQLVNGTVNPGPLKKAAKVLPFINFDLTSFTRSLPSVHQLLPEYACIESENGLLKTTETSLPHLDSNMVSDAMEFHSSINQAALTDKPYKYNIYPISGIQQDTYTTARLVHDSIEPIYTIDGINERGDSTVPRLSAMPKEAPPDSGITRTVSDQHGALQNNENTYTQIEGILTATSKRYRDSTQLKLGIYVDPLVLAGENVNVEAMVVASKRRIALQVSVLDERNREVASSLLRKKGEIHSASIKSLTPGVYKLIVGGRGSAAEEVSSVTAMTIVWN